MNEFFEQVPHPRVMAHGFSDAEMAVLRPLCGGLEQFHADWHPEEHDVLLTTNARTLSHSPVRFRIMFMPPPVENSDEYGASSASRSWIQDKPARNLEITSFAEEQRLAALIRNSCVPEAGARYRGIHLPVSPGHTAYPLLRERLARPYVLAAILENNNDPKTADFYQSTLWLPASARSHLADWFRYAVSRWRALRPDLFPETAEWRSSDAWASPDERRARTALIDFDEREDERRAEAAIQRAALAEQVDSARVDGDNDRKILEATGEDLVAIVHRMLQDLGFDVIDADQMPQHKGKKREDLRVSDSAWTAVVEVKGYTGAAKSNDLMQVQRAMTMYAATEKKLPDAAWYVVNTYREMDPSQRPEPLAERPEDVADFADSSDGTVLDTRELFKLWRSVRAGELHADEARTVLRENRGYFKNAPLS
ncbi:hypothetical protein ACQ3HE_19315 [Plantibacter auratus]|uniref:hypothetical protein n=1 Tax=Plantibacter auratus TaxID=272914 RepID=UPI003D34152D